MTKILKKPAASVFLLVAAIFLISPPINLRPAITGVGPVLEFIRADPGLSALLAGVLTSIPLAAFAFMSPWAAAIGGKLGMERAIFIASIVIAAGVLLRSAPSLVALYAGSILLAAAIAVGNVLVPGLIKRDFPDKVGLMTSVYATTLATFASISSGISVPLAQTLPGGWRGALAVWCISAHALRIRRHDLSAAVYGVLGGGFGALRSASAFRSRSRFSRCVPLTRNKRQHSPAWRSRSVTALPL